MNDLALRMARLRTYSAGISALMESVKAGAPRSAQGWDPSGSVQVTIDAAGLPTAISVEPEWEREVAPAALGGAVQAAYTAAVADGMATWSATLEQADWAAQVEALDQTRAAAPGSLAAASPTSRAAAPGSLAAASPPAVPAAPGYPAAASPTPPAPPAASAQPDAAAAPPDLGTLIEDVISSLHAARTRATAPVLPAVGSGAGGGGRVSVQLSPAGLQSCVIDASWATGQQAETLVSAISGALDAARADLSRATTPDPDGPAVVPVADRFASGALVADALTALAALTAPSTSATSRDQQPEDHR